ncbi:DUF4870 domain-containing protein [Lutimonas zeaxanthinifaciens]|uniref:DUF4870 domain-containing protein n=1 Tax=Lutimonas zeaxanthinifaciens TaxID=3060215 RepID=UPI00265D4740|nr:DUF4870 domain-containing protein [Lutimonas sp. YSD2104]WKK66962.1 DUF4870 domain-containing protein [Lutimonas sp. YSD2104]
MSKQNDHNNAFLLHLSAFFGYIFPFGAIVGPLVIWELNKRKSEFMDQNGKEAINFNLSYLLYTMILGLSIVPFVLRIALEDFQHLDLFGIVSVGSLIGILAIVKFVLIIVAALKANRGEVYKYPLTIKFIK